ncbi:MAG: hypothetical protein GY778_11665, partial [bacterium]|nr:hypothetical protein [bacterium]
MDAATEIPDIVVTAAVVAPVVGLVALVAGVDHDDAPRAPLARPIGGEAPPRLAGQLLRRALVGAALGLGAHDVVLRLAVPTALVPHEPIGSLEVVALQPPIVDAFVAEQAACLGVVRVSGEDKPGGVAGVGLHAVRP